MGSEDGTGELPERGRGSVRVHEPVMLGESLAVLDLAPGMIVVDGTVGALGHGLAIAQAIQPGGVLVGLDRDAGILARAEEVRGASSARAGIRLFHLVFTRMREALDQLGLASCDRVFLDLGVSSLQLDTPERGFSFMHDARLDMRMDPGTGLTAESWLRRVSEAELARVLFEYGEERHARPIARRIVAAARRGAMTRTSDLVDAVLGGRPLRGGRIHPATRTFQAIRMAVNDEPGQLRAGLEAALDCLAPGGRLAVISFHSFEDRIVKRFMRAHLRPLTPKPLRPSAAERQRNPRSRSAKLRCGEVVRKAAAEPR